jgi:hypothetical protein
MLKEQLRLARELSDIKGIFHQEEDIDIIGEWLGRHKGAKDYAACQMPCRPCHIVDAFKPQTKQHTLWGATPKAFQYSSQRCTVETWR